MSLTREVVQRLIVALLACAFILILTGFAHAAKGGGWVDAHLTGSDTRVRVEQDGSASVELGLTYRVAAGALHSVDLVGLRVDALDPTAEVRAEDGSVQAAGVTMDEKGVHLAFEGKGLKRGVWSARLHGTTRFGAGRGLTNDGALWRLVWSSPTTNEGLDGARVVFDLPAGPTEPRAVHADAAWGQGDEGTRPDALGAIATLRRLADRDELELVRPHVGRGEAASWAARVDPKAFPAIADAELRPPARAAAPPPAPKARWGLFALLAAIGVGFAALVRHKTRAAEAHGARPLAALPLSGHAIGGGAALALAAWLAVHERATLAALAVAAAAAFATFVAGAPRPRAGGVWLALRPDEAFTPVRRDAFDLGGTLGRVALLGAIIGLVVLARVLSIADERAPIWVAEGACALVPLFVTGLAASRAPGPAADGALLAPLASALEAEQKVVPWARTADDGVTLELRVFVAPRPPMPGLVGVEIGVGWSASGRAWVPRLELLARVRAESPAHARLLGWEGARPASREPGRKTDERVFRWIAEPGAPALEAARALASALTERREAGPAALDHADRRRAAAPGPRPTPPRPRAPEPAPAPKKGPRPFVRVAAA